MYTNALQIHQDICKPHHCNTECLESCKRSKHQKKNILYLGKSGFPEVNLKECNFCGLCVSTCPLGAISFTRSSKTSQKRKNSIIKTVDTVSHDMSKWYEVNESIYKRFSQRNVIFGRRDWDTSFEHYKIEYYEKAAQIISQGKKGYSREGYSLYSAARSVYMTHKPAFSWEKVPGTITSDPIFMNMPKVDPDTLDPESVSQKIKEVAKFFGAALVGICQINPRWVYSHNIRGEEINLPEGVNWAIVMAIEMDYDMLLTSPAVPSAVTAGNAYSQMAYATACLGEYIRGLGYTAISSGNDTALNVPLAIDAGLGEFGRNGLLITRKFGPRIRLCKVLTDLPLIPDQPTEFGAKNFCRTCKKCARACPSGSISMEDEPSFETVVVSNNPGVKKWYVNVESCYGFWVENGMACSNCLSSCPFNKNTSWIHGIARWSIRNLPFLNRWWIWLDDIMGYGKQKNLDRY